MNLSQEEWAAQYQEDDNAFLLDVRTPEEYDEAHIPGATNIDIYNPEFVNEIETLDKTKTYYVYCRSGGRSGKACGIMNELGFENAYNLLGGMMEWEGATE